MKKKRSHLAVALATGLIATFSAVASVYADNGGDGGGVGIKAAFTCFQGASLVPGSALQGPPFATLYASKDEKTWFAEVAAKAPNSNQPKSNYENLITNYPQGTAEGLLHFEAVGFALDLFLSRATDESHIPAALQYENNQQENKVDLICAYANE